jgi:hypothetical protein
MDYPLILVTTACYPWKCNFSWLTSRSSQATTPKLSEFVCPQAVRQQAENDAFPPISSQVICFTRPWFCPRVDDDINLQDHGRSHMTVYGNESKHE